MWSYLPLALYHAGWTRWKRIIVGQTNNGVRYRKPKHPHDSWSEEGEHPHDSWSEEGEVSSDDGRRIHSRQSYCSTVSSEGLLSDEENTSEVSMKDTTDGLLSTNSTENLQMELAKCMTQDGLSSDAEMKFKRLKQRASPQRSLEVNNGYTSSDSDECSDATVHSTIHRKRSLDNRDW